MENKLEKLIEIRDYLIELRNGCLELGGFDTEGAVLLSHTIHWLHCKIKGEKFEPNTD
jgi:hypothetical protein